MSVAFYILVTGHSFFWIGKFHLIRIVTFMQFKKKKDWLISVVKVSSAIEN